MFETRYDDFFFIVTLKETCVINIKQIFFFCYRYVISCQKSFSSYEYSKSEASDDFNIHVNVTKWKVKLFHEYITNAKKKLGPFFFRSKTPREQKAPTLITFNTKNFSRYGKSLFVFVLEMPSFERIINAAIEG